MFFSVINNTRFFTLILFLLSSCEIFHKNQKENIFAAATRSEINGVWHGNLGELPFECFYFLFSNQEPTENQVPALVHLENDFYTFNIENGKLGKKKVDTQVDKNIFANLNFNSGIKSSLSLKQCEYISAHGGHIIKPQEDLSKIALQLSTTGISFHEQQRIVERMESEKNPSLQNAVLNDQKLLDEKLKLRVTGAIFISKFPKTLPKFCHFSEESTFPLSGYLDKDELFLSFAENSIGYGISGSIIMIRLKKSGNNLLEGTYSFLNPFNSPAIIKNPIIFKREE